MPTTETAPPARVRLRPRSTDCSLADEARRASMSRVEELRARANAASKEIGKAEPRRAPGVDRRGCRREDRPAGRRGRARRHRHAEVDELALTIPNPAAEACPSGGEDDYEVVEVIGEPTEAPPLDHAEFGEAMGWVETDAGEPEHGQPLRVSHGRGGVVGVRTRAVDDGQTGGPRASPPSPHRCSSARR